MPVLDKNLLQEMSPDIKNHFPFAEVRPSQETILKTIEQAYRDDKKFIIVEAPTGVGKSGIAIAAASHAKTFEPRDSYKRGAYILSPQKSLVTQYLKDFASMGLVELKGQANYICHNFTEQAGMEIDCETAAMLYEEEHNIGTCTGYKPAKQRFIEAPMGVTNFDYFLNEQMHAGQLPQRNLLTCDEGHGVEQKILGFTDTAINKRRCDEYGVEGGLPTFSAGFNDDVADWLHKSFTPAAEQFQRNLKVEVGVAKETGDKELAVKLFKKLDASKKFMQRVGYFLNADDRRDWLAWSDWDEEKRKGTNDLTIKPLTATLFADQILFSKADKVLLMSATILGFPTFMRNLGIDPADAATISVPSEFPLENRPIFYKPVGNMGYKHIDKTLPKVAAFVEKILNKYADKKGVIHTHSFKVNKCVVDHLRGCGFGDRVITHDSSKGSRDRAVEDHINSTKASVLISPSMSEGLDLKDDLSRFQVICKTMYPALDPYVRARMDRDSDWYTLQTALKMVQASGRSVRSKTDKAHTFILDSGFSDWFSRASGMLPNWWSDSIVWPS